MKPLFKSNFFIKKAKERKCASLASLIPFNYQLIIYLRQQFVCFVVAEIYFLPLEGIFCYL